MKLFRIFLLICFIIAAHSLRLFMVGGHNYENSAVFNDLAASIPNRQPSPDCGSDWNTTKCPRVAVLTSSHETEAEGNDTYNNDDQVSLSYEHIFLKYGMSPKHISVHADNYLQTANSNTTRGKIALQILKSADILYLTGGDQSKHIRAWLNDDGSHNELLSVIRDRALKDEIVVSGSSAGSMVYIKQIYGYGSPYGVIYYANSDGLAPKTVKDAAVNGTNLADDRHGIDTLQFNENAGKMPGFNWVHIAFDTHFHAWGRTGRLPAILYDLKLPIGLGLDENTTFFYENGKGRVIGEHAVTIFDISQAIKLPSKYFQMANVKVHYLTEGDHFDFTTKKVTSSKPLITSPRYKTFSDSDDIFGPYQAVRLLTHLVDQTPLYNSGAAHPPQGYPKDAPTFQLTFSKNGETKGYRNGQAYTVVSAIIDYSYSVNTNLLVQS